MYRDELNGLLSEVDKRSHHPYALNYVRFPGIKLFQLHFLFLFLNHIGLDPILRNHYCISQMLIQLGLDSHDFVGNQDLNDDSAIKERQLTILIGDYFSGHYYQYLAEHNQVELITRWAQVIKTVNEDKLRLYAGQNSLTESEKLQLKQKIRRYVAESVLHWFNADPVWFNILHSYVALKMYAEEISVFRGKVEVEAETMRTAINQLDDKVLQKELNLWLDKTQLKELLIGS
jgi:heptaprenyl diphosphate synthase